MRATDKPPQRIFRRDYREPDYWIDEVDLEFELGEEETKVHATLAVRRNPAAAGAPPLVLDGEKLTLQRVALDGRELAADAFHVDASSLTIPDVPARFQLQTTVTIRPQDNTELSGLYKSSGNFCTQCEAEGFRRITWFLDRPDVMARYRAKITADATRYPVLLSNGNRLAEGKGPGNMRWVQWEDPFPKPSYLFALVAGDLRCHTGSYTTASGREVRLEIWVEPVNIDKCEHALRSLQKAMKWDEETFGLEYDLDLYMIVAVNDFNMGAMENKGLNIFNSKFVLARPDTATDDDYERIEGVIAHEYFHNWTGNRVTCRDWFQLTLKEGLTVFRDQQFAMDVQSAAVKRIQDIKRLRTLQFAEDAGPMAHPIRPESYIEMNNFYTLTVYEKGAEVVRMYQTLLGRDGFRRGMDLYFERHDGSAVTCDDFRAAMADANRLDLGQFERWYLQAGTPTLAAEGTFDEARGEYTLTLTQTFPVTAEQPDPQPTLMPVAVGLLGPDGHDLPLRLAGATDDGTTTRVLRLTEATQSFVFTGLAGPPTPSILRGFSAPVKLVITRSREELAFLLAHDSDPFQRWDAGQELALSVLLDLARDWRAGQPLALDPRFVEAFRAVLADVRLNGSYRRLALDLPDEQVIVQHMELWDYEAAHAAREFVRSELARALHADLEAIYEETCTDEPYAFSRAQIDQRRLKNLALAYLAQLADPTALARVADQGANTDNMTDAFEALRLLADIDCPQRAPALARFYEAWHHDPLVLDKWFMAQALSKLPATPQHVHELTRHPDFRLENPNRVRSLLHTFATLNPVRFHTADGSAYRLIADKVLALDARNPQVAARLVAAFNHWRKLPAHLQELMRLELSRIAAQPKLSRDVFEIVNRALG